MPRRTRKTRVETAEAPALVQWEEQDPQVPVFDWRQRANDWGVKDQPLSEEEPEAQAGEREQDDDDEEREDSFDADELTHEAPEAGLGAAEPDSVRRYLGQIGKTKLLTAAQEAQIGQQVERATSDLVAAITRIPSAVHDLVSL